VELTLFDRKSEFEWHIRPFGAMRVPGVIFASEALMRDMDTKVFDQVTNVAKLPGIVKASYAMPMRTGVMVFPSAGWRHSMRQGGRGVGGRGGFRYFLRRAHPAYRPED